MNLCETFFLTLVHYLINKFEIHGKIGNEGVSNPKEFITSVLAEVYVKNKISL